MVAALLFTLGAFGLFVGRKNIIVLLMAIELILLAVNINLVAFSAALEDAVGQVLVMFILTVAAAESRYRLGNTGSLLSLAGKALKSKMWTA